jgi:hypothetical protein
MLSALFAESPSFGFPSSAEDIVTGKDDFPPELAWWLLEAQKLNAGIKIEDFKFYKEYRINGDNIEIPEKLALWEEPQIILDVKTFRPFFVFGYYTHTLFNKWNFLGDTVAHYDFGAAIEAGSSGSILSFDSNRISVLLIQDYNDKRIYKIYYMPKSGICGMAWLYSNILITVETEIKYNMPNIYGSKPYMVNLIMSSMYLDKEHLEKDLYNIRVTKYIYENAFTVDEYKGIKLKEFEQRPKNFKEITGDVSF